MMHSLYYYQDSSNVAGWQDLSSFYNQYDLYNQGWRPDYNMYKTSLLARDADWNSSGGDFSYSHSNRVRNLYRMCAYNYPKHHKGDSKMDMDLFLLNKLSQLKDGNTGGGGAAGGYLIAPHDSTKTNFSTNRIPFYSVYSTNGRYAYDNGEWSSSNHYSSFLYFSDMAHQIEERFSLQRQRLLIALVPTGIIIQQWKAEDAPIPHNGFTIRYIRLVA